MNDEPPTSASDELGAHADLAEAAGLDEIALRLERDRPMPRDGFRAQLRSRLAELEQAPKRTAVGRQRLLIASYALSGTACLVAGALSLSGSGPLAP